MKTKNRKATITNYYDIQQLQDSLYEKSSKKEKFYNLMEYVTLPENIKLAYRTIKTNTGSNTVGIDKRNIKFISKMKEEEYVKYFQDKLNNYNPKMVRRVEIPKANGKSRPLGIPCIEDRIIQQCILQVLEPICEAKFYDYSYGFRPNRSTEHAIAMCYKLMQRSKLQYVVDVDIKGFFDNVNHKKLIRQLWTIGIRDTRILQVIKRMLKAPILLPNQTIEYPTKGTPQGGILSPLLANVVLNELDWWIASQWTNYYKVMKKVPQMKTNKNGSKDLGNVYRDLRKTSLKEIYIVRYADDVKIFCRTRADAVKIKFAVIQWLRYRLKLTVSEEKSGITNLKKKYCKFLGFKLKLRTKGKKEVVKARMSDEARKNAKANLTRQIGIIQRANNKFKVVTNINLYNSMVVGIQNYYGIANNVYKDFNKIQYSLNKIIKNRLKVKKQGEFDNEFLKERYGKSKQVRWFMSKAIIPIGYYKSRNPMCKKRNINQYTKEGRMLIYKQPQINISVMRYLMRNPIPKRTIEYNDNRISLYIGQKGKCAVTGLELEIGKMHCHHIVPIKMGGSDNYDNLIFVDEKVHRLLHAVDNKTIEKYLNSLGLNMKSLKKINKLRSIANLEIIQRKYD